MTGPEHYAEAERLLEISSSTSAHGFPDNPQHLPMLAAAQIHATLALAAATALPEDYQDSGTWRDVTGQG